MEQSSSHQISRGPNYQALQSLYSAILQRYTYDNLKELCFGSNKDFPLVFDCQWDIWRRKAVTDFDISPQFFDLIRSSTSNGIRSLSGPQRYLQIATYVKLTPLSGVRVYQDTDIVEGVYEAIAGFREASFRKDLEALLWFANRIKPEQDEASKVLRPSYQGVCKRVEELISRWEEEREEEVHYPPQDNVYDLNYLWLAITKGRIDILDKIIHRYFTLPKGFSIEKDIPKTPFWEIRDEQGRDRTIYNLPLQDLEVEDFNYLVRPILSSGDTRIVDFFRSIFRDRDFNSVLRDNFLSAYKSLLYHHKPEEAYGIDLRFFNKESYRGGGLAYSYMIESLLYALQHDEHPEEFDWMSENLGDIPYLAALLASIPYEREDILPITGDETLRVLYPLSIKILEDYLLGLE
ncbi:Hypothetical protein BQ3484_162 [Cedratvirus A11]|uniref:Uncharacterized protein n=1 Tax=Cedratvirus A11 TaxID=1903266 RepID=A0A1M7XUI1_9VIRU|nr:Hypothetical protein BQ3484_162 [Cedratvirus A11]SHO33230.1 Hypothetical protein BQ3484_162 [Cedratvirus A11]